MQHGCDDHFLVRRRDSQDLVNVGGCEFANYTPTHSSYPSRILPVVCLAISILMIVQHPSDHSHNDTKRPAPSTTPLVKSCDTLCKYPSLHKKKVGSYGSGQSRALDFGSPAERANDLSLIVGRTGLALQSRQEVHCIGTNQAQHREERTLATRLKTC